MAFFLSPSEFGTVELLLAFAATIGVLMNCGLDSAQSYFYYFPGEDGFDKRAALATSILTLRIILGVLMVGCVYVCWPFLEKIFPAGIHNGVFLIIIISIATLAMQIHGQLSDLFRLQRRAWKFISLSLVYSLSVTIFCSIGIALFADRVVAYSVCYTLAGILSAVVALALLRNYLRSSPGTPAECWKILCFSIPLVPGALALMFMGCCDRWFIAHLLSGEEVGIYAVGAKIALAVTAAIEAFRRAWWPLAMELVHKPDTGPIFRVVSVYYLAVGTVAAYAITILSPFALTWFFPVSYERANMVIGILVWQSVMFGFYMICSIGIWKKQKTAITSLISILAVLANAALCLEMIPRFGIWGAAFASVASTILWSGLATFFSERLWPIGMPFVRWIIQIGFGIMATESAKNATTVSAHLISVSFLIIAITPAILIFMRRNT